MPGILDQLTASPSPSSIAHRLESGASPSALCLEYNLTPSSLFAFIASIGLGDSNSPGPPLIQRRPPHPKLVASLHEHALSSLFPSAPRPSLLALAAGLYQVLDAWDASHDAAQLADDLGERSSSAYWHGIAHRREPDAWNSGYWFRKVGRHPIFDELARSSLPLLQSHPDSPRPLRGDSWDPSAFIDLCTSSRPGSPSESLALSLQRLEMDLLLAHSLSHVV